MRNGVNLYDFLARTYIPDLGRFAQPDPKAGDYHGISPYVYCGGDPINYTDPTGRDLVIYVDGINYKWEFKTGYGWGFFSEDGTEYSGNDEFMNNLTQSLRMFISKPVGLSIVKSLVGSTKITVVKNGENLDQDETTYFDVPTNTIYMDYANPVGAKVEGGVDYNPSIALAHEMVHARFGKNQMGLWIREHNISNSEKYVIHYENMVRAEYCLPLRTHYKLIEKEKDGKIQFEGEYPLIQPNTRMSIYYKFPTFPNGMALPYHYFRYLKR